MTHFDRETNNHSGEDNGVKIAEGNEASNQGSEKADVSNDTLEDLVDQMEIEISDLEGDKVDGATANKEDAETAEADVELDNEESGTTQNRLKTAIKGSLRSGHFTIVRKLFLSVFSEHVVCAHAVSVPPTTNLNWLVTGYLPIHCVNKLVKTMTFRNHGISIKDWILQQLLTVWEPHHPILAPLLQEFVNAILIPSQKSTTYRTKNKAGVHETVHMPFSADEVLSVFQQDPDSSNSKSSISSQLLMLYYVLLYQSCYHNNLKSLLVQSPSAPSSTPGSYSTAVIAKIPIKHLLSYAQQYQSSFSNLYPTLLKLISIQFPYLCLVCEWLTEKKIITDLHFKPIARISKEMLRPESAQAILEKLQTQPSQALLLLTQLSTFSPSSIIRYTQAILSTLTLLLDPQIPRRIQDLYITLWTKLNVVIPRKLLLQTVNTLRPASVKHMRPFSHQNIAEDPLIILRCDSTVFRCPPLFDILLRIASVCTTYSSSWLQEHAYIQNCVAMTTPDPKSSPVEGKAMKAQREELCNALITTQESALIQMLLEICVPNDKDKEEEACFGPQLTALQEIRCLFCSYLHHTFICEPTLIKLVHFQGTQHHFCQ